MKRNQALVAKADGEAEKVLKVIKPLREAGQTLSGIAKALEDMGVKTSRGGDGQPNRSPGSWTGLRICAKKLLSLSCTSEDRWKPK